MEAPRTFRFPLLSTAFLFLAAISAPAQIPSTPSAVTPAATMLLEFMAPGCGYCRQIEPLIRELAALGYPIRQIDAAQYPQIVQQYGIESYPTFIMLANGVVVDRITGGGDPMTLRPRVLRMFEAAREYLAAPTSAPRQPGQAASAESIPTTMSPQPSSGVASPETLATAPPTAPPTAPVMIPATLESPAASPVAHAFAPVGNQELGVKPAFDAAACRRSSVRLWVNDASGHSWGTGTIIDTRNGHALILTCAHIFREAGGKGATAEVHLFSDGPEVKTQGVCIRCDLEIDLALVVITPPCPVEARPVMNERQSISVGELVFSAGCDGGADPTVWEHRILSLEKFSKQRPDTAPFHYVQISGTPVKGRSGGGLFSADGSLIGVCNAADPESNSGLFVPSNIIRQELDRENLSVVHHMPSLRDASAGMATSPGIAQPALVQPPVAQPFAPTVSPATAPTGAPMKPLSAWEREQHSFSLLPETATEVAARVENLSEVEQATLEEIQRRQEEGDEVILFVRSRRHPQHQTDVIRLQNVSDRFLQELSQNIPNVGQAETAAGEPEAAQILLASPGSSHPQPVSYRVDRP